MSISGNPLRIFRGEDITVVVPVQGVTSTAGWTVTFDAFDADGSLLFSRTPTLDSPAAGSLSVAVASADTVNTPTPTSGRYECWRSDSGARTMLCDGPLRILTRLTP